MRILPQERKWFTPIGLAATNSHGTPITVAVTSWEASFDKGATWKTSRDDGGNPGWLIAGSAYPGTGDSAGAIVADAVLAADTTVTVLIRLRDTPETTINDELTITTY